MTEGIEVAIIGGASTIIAALGGTLLSQRSRRKEKKSEGKNLPTPSKTLPETDKPPLSNAPSKQNRALVDPKTAMLTHKQIEVSLASLPPSEKERVAQNYVGVVVAWAGHLMGMSGTARSPQGDMVTVKLESVDNRCVCLFCNALTKDCDVLRFLNQNSVVLVTGRISNVSEHNAVLDDCTFRIIAPAGDVSQSGLTKIPPSTRI